MQARFCAAFRAAISAVAEHFQNLISCAVIYRSIGFASKVGLCVDLWGKRHFCKRGVIKLSPAVDNDGFTNMTFAILSLT
jgi:hypothetical protein